MNDNGNASYTYKGFQINQTRFGFEVLGMGKSLPLANGLSEDDAFLFADNYAEILSVDEIEIAGYTIIDTERDGWCVYFTWDFEGNPVASDFETFLEAADWALNQDL